MSGGSWTVSALGPKVREIVTFVGSKPVVYMVCTGNAARSPMAAAMLRDCDAEGRLDVRSAGVLVLEGHPMGARTRAALARHGLVDHSHRSCQFSAADAAEADVVVVMEALHLRWMRSNLPTCDAITGSLRRLARDLRPPDRSGHRTASLRERLASLGLAERDFEPWEEVIDPAAGDQQVFDRCADDLRLLVERLYRRL